MFKGTRWRADKNKNKAGFKLQFHATQVPQIGWETMVVTLVPMDVGKPTVRSEKAMVIGGECHWLNPIKETVKLVKDHKTGKTNEKIYRFLVSATRSEKCGFLGEISINLAGYTEVLKPAIVSLPLKAPSSGVILHVTIQRTQADFDGREDDGRKMTSEFTNCDEDETYQVPTSNASKEDHSFIKNYAQLIFPAGKTVSPQSKSNGNLRNSSSTQYISVSGSDSSSAHYTSEKAGTNNTKTLEDTASFLSPVKTKGIPRNESNGLIDLVKDYRDHWSQSSNTGSSVDAPPNGSMDWSTDNSVETGLRGRLQDQDDSIEKYISGDVTPARQLELLELELQTLRKQVVMERRRGHDLSLELSGLKEERDALRSECEELKGSQARIGEENISSWSQLNGEDLESLLGEIKQELNHEKNSNAYLRLQLQKTQESNAELILAVQDLDELLEQNNKEVTCPNCSKPATREEPGNAFSHSQSPKCKQELFETISDDDGQRALETLMKEHNSVAVEYSLEQKIIDLNREIELYKKDRDDLEMQMEQLALDYEILKQENHTMSSRLEQIQMQEQLQMQYECSAHLSIITDLETHVINLEKELEEQADSFEADIEIISRGKIEQEKRAIVAEEALRTARQNTAKTAEQLKEDFNRLSTQISSSYHFNESLASQALKEADELRSQKCRLEEMLEETNAELTLVRDQSRMKHQELLNLIDSKTKEADELLMELKMKSEELKNNKLSEEYRQKGFSEDILVLKSEMKILLRDRCQLVKEIEQKEVLLGGMEQLKTSAMKTESLLQEIFLEREMLVRELTSMRDQGKKLLEEQNELKQLKDEKEALISSLKSELETLRAEYAELKRSLLEDDLEKDSLRKQIFKLRGDLKNKEDTIATMDKNFKDNNARVAAADTITKTALKNKNNKSSATHPVSKEVTNLHEKIKLLEGKIKLKDDALEDAKNSFLMKEMDLSNRIEELERSIIQSESCLHEGTVHKMQVINNVENGHSEANANGNILAQANMGDKASIDDVRGIDRGPNPSSTIGADSKNEEECLISADYDHPNLAELLDETENLKEKNKFMETELREMNERYSEISLKFAEVEGERQQLVMTVRALRNSVKY